MILSFKSQFVLPIKQGKKVHTIRADQSARWKAGTKIHFWKGNPRNPDSNPYEFKQGECVCVQSISIIKGLSLQSVFSFSVFIDDEQVTDDATIEELIRADGLLVHEFYHWFIPDGTRRFDGKIIHWTEKRYDVTIEKSHIKRKNNGKVDQSSKGSYIKGNPRK